MRRYLGLIFATLIAGSAFTMARADSSAYDFSFTSIEGTPLPLSDYRGKAILLVNTASQCGFTPQYDDLQAVWKQYQPAGLVVLGVPSNDFGGQEPGSESEIKEFCEVNFGLDFPITTKEHVRGAEAHPLYQWLAATMGGKSAPAWNFHKYLIGRDGQPVAWFPSRVKPTDAEATEAIEGVLSSSPTTN